VSLCIHFTAIHDHSAAARRFATTLLVPSRVTSDSFTLRGVGTEASASSNLSQEKRYTTKKKHSPTFEACPDRLHTAPPNAPSRSGDPWSAAADARQHRSTTSSLLCAATSNQLYTRPSPQPKKRHTFLASRSSACTSLSMLRVSFSRIRLLSAWNSLYNRRMSSSFL